MKKTMYVLLLAAVAFSGLASCGPTCKKCAAEMMGVRGPEREICGDELKQVESMGVLKCK